MWQFVAFRGKEYGLDRNWWEDERMNPEEATRAAARHLKDLFYQFGDWYLAMAAYNCGPGCVSKAVERTGYADFWELSRRRVLPAQTRNYVPVILALMIIGRNPEKYGLEDLEMESAWTYDTVSVSHPVDLRLVAEIVGTSVETIRELNPSLLRSTTPNVPGYMLRIPLATQDLFLKRIAMIPPEKRVYWRWHTVRYGETLSGIAKQFKASVSAIAEVNNLNPAEPLKEATELVIPVGGSGSSGPVALAGERHRVTRGETLSSIARKYGVTLDQLRAWNNLKGSVIQIGSSLVVAPERATEPIASASTSGRHTVRRNETLSIIAGRYNITVSQLMAWNGLNDTTIRVGSVLRVRRPEALPAPSTVRTVASTNTNGVSKTSAKVDGRDTMQVHLVQKGESLSQIASAYAISLDLLRRSNQHLGAILQVGDRVYIPSLR
jgi:membrane-bound lytic murein transglycosylase D